MAFKMKGSAFKLNEVATKSALKHKATESVEFKSGQEAASAKAHNKTYGTPKHHDSPEKKKERRKNVNAKGDVHVIDKGTSTPTQMKSPMKGKTIPAPDEIAKEHNRKHDAGEWNNDHETEEDYKKRINRFKDKDKEAPTKMKSPLEQTVPISPVTGKPYEQWVMDKPEGEARNRAMEAHDENKRILADPDLQANAEHVIKNVHPDYFVQDED